MRKKILVLFTGGTIGSYRDKTNIVDVSPKNPPNLIERYRSVRHGNEIDFTTEAPINILSENASFLDWETVYSAVVKAENAFDGIIVTHGTDTLAYASCLFSLLLPDIGVPLVFVSSNYPLQDIRTQGYINFTSAVDFISNAGIPGVFAATLNHGRKEIHLGSRLTQSRAFTNCFRSVSGEPLGWMEEETFHPVEHEFNPRISADRERMNPKPSRGFPKMERSVMLIPAFPGLDYSLYSWEQKPGAILHELYHSGTACTKPGLGGNHSVADFALKCKEQKIDFYAAPFQSRDNLYASSKDMLDAGIRFIRDMSLEASLMKLFIAYNRCDSADKITRYLEANIAYEKLIPLC